MLPKTSTGEFLILEDSLGANHDLITIKTSSKKKKEMEKEIKTNLSNWAENVSRNFPQLHDIETKLDIAIVVYRKGGYLGRQDLDNIAKIVLDALKGVLFKDDSQVARLLLFKKEAKQLTGFKTDSAVISFRVHNPDKQMALVVRHII
jgi:Holliday junction resolvase RusA-like endonuclease